MEEKKEEVKVIKLSIISETMNLNEGTNKNDMEIS